MDHSKVETLIRELLHELGEDPERPGLLDTPRRVATALAVLTSGYSADLSQIVNHAKFEQQDNSMIIVRDIEIYSLCEHHLLPFFGRCHIGYIPKKEALGVSKLARIADVFSRRLQMQERLTEQLANAIMRVVEPEGVGVIIEGQHLCMMMRGVEKQKAIMTTSVMLGSFRSSHSTRTEFLSLIGQRRP
ncbi:MAG: GTP cyclohydrolase I FolE [Polyangiaceae bacterium]|nr:GTP cyclohydrolase I FolE [Polyangiaceae bacterium]